MDPEAGMELSKRTGRVQNKRDPEVRKLLQTKTARVLSLLPPWQDLLTENPYMTPDSDPKEGFCSTAEEERKKISEANSHVLHLIKAIDLHKL